MDSTLWRPARIERLAVGALVLSGLFWGLTWLPLKHFASEGLSGLAMTLLSYGIVGVLAVPLIWRQRDAWRSQTRLLVIAGLTGGAANVCFVSGLGLGEVVRVMLMFYLAPIWGVLGGRLFLGEPLCVPRVTTFPTVSPLLLLQTTAFAGIWMMAAMWTTMYGVTHLEAGRASVLLVFELVVAVASAMVIGGERMSALEWLGAALITSAALLEARSGPAVERIPA